MSLTRLTCLHCGHQFTPTLAAPALVHCPVCRQSAPGVGLPRARPSGLPAVLLLVLMAGAVVAGAVVMGGARPQPSAMSEEDRADFESLARALNRPDLGFDVEYVGTTAYLCGARSAQHGGGGEDRFQSGAKDVCEARLHDTLAQANAAAKSLGDRGFQWGRYTFRVHPGGEKFLRHVEETIHGWK